MVMKPHDTRLVTTDLKGQAQNRGLFVFVKQNRNLDILSWAQWAVAGCFSVSGDSSPRFYHQRLLTFWLAARRLKHALPSQVNALTAVSTSVPHPFISAFAPWSHLFRKLLLPPIKTVPCGRAAGWLAVHSFVPACLPPGSRSRCNSPGRNMFLGLDKRVGFCLLGCGPKMQIHPLSRSERERESVLLLHEQISSLLTYILLSLRMESNTDSPYLTFW